MAKPRITQETFDAAVKENMEEFEMDADEALKDAVEQFESQGVDLSCIVLAVRAVSTDDKQEEQTHEVLQALDSLQTGQDSTSVTDANLMVNLKCFTQQCSLGFAQRYLAAQKDAYPVILSICKRSVEQQEALLAALAALAALTDGQPDLLDSDGKKLLLDVLSKYQAEVSVMCVAILTVHQCCLKHEQNRQDLVKGGVVRQLIRAVTRHTECAKLVKEISTALRVLTLDDDVRVEFGQAHEHAKIIVLEHDGLKVLIDAAKVHRDDTAVLSELCSTLSRLAVRNEFCQDICDLGGLQLMMTLLADSYESPVLVRQVLCAIRAVAGNDDVKDAVVNAGGVELIVMVMSRHASNPSVCEQGCACLSVIALRKPSNCTAIMEIGGALAAVQAMRTHPKSVNVQTQACMLLRNMVSRMPNFCQPILEMGTEALITKALRTHQDLGDIGVAALRDLGCKVELRELWTGKHGSLPD